MKIAITKKPFCIPNEKLNRFSVEKIEERLGIFNQSCSGEYYIVDYFREKIIIGSPHASILCGYSKSVLDALGFQFYNRILKKRELSWIMRMNKAAYKLFFRYPKSKRNRIVVSYDLSVVMVEGTELVLHHKVMPYKLCNNGNVWLGLCHVTVSPRMKMSRKAYFVNTATEERYDLIKDEFVLSDEPAISLDEKQILQWMIQGLPNKTMALLSGVSINTFKARKLQLFDKLEAKTSAEAIHQAHLLGIF